MPRLLDTSINLVVDRFGNPHPALVEASPGFLAALHGIRLGSNWPFEGHAKEITFAQAMSWVERFIPDRAQRAQIGYTAACLYHVV